MLLSPAKDDCRTLEQVREHYEIEKALASRLRHSARAERRHLYATLYDELFERVPHHPQLVRKAMASEGGAAKFQLSFLGRFLAKADSFLEIGPGDCALTLEVVKSVKKVYGLDVSETITGHPSWPENFQLIISDGCSIPLPTNSLDVVYSNQLMEHLHPEDALDQLAEVHRVLNPGGVYVCVTPHRLSGPHDISRYYDSVATGFHLKEYTVSELYDMFTCAGFASVKVYVGGQSSYLCVPAWPIIASEKLLSVLPPTIRKMLMTTLPLRVLFGIRIAGVK